MRKVKIFGKSIPVLAIVAIAMSAGLVSAALVSYLSDTITTSVSVESPIELSGTITYQTTEYEASVITAPDIDGIVDVEKWDGAVEIPVANDIGTVKVLATTDYLYVLFDIADSDDAREGQTFGNDQTSININPTAGDLWGKPCDIIFQMGADPKAWDGISSGQTDSWETDWEIKGEQQSLPADLETKTIYNYEASRRISEWKIPLASISPSLGDTLKVGGAITVGDTTIDPSIYPINLDWSDASTYEHYTIGKPVVVTEGFDDAFSELIPGGSVFFMDFEAKNLANSEMAVTLGLVIESTSGMTGEEIWRIDPEPSQRGVSGTLFAAAFNLGTIGAGETVEQPVTIQLAPDAKPETYTIRAVAVWTNALEASGAPVSYIVDAAEIT